MRLSSRLLTGLAFVTSLGLAQGNAAAQGDPALDFVRQARQLNNQGKFDDALALYEKAENLSPNLYEIHAGMGVTLDLKGQYEEARKHLARAIELASAQQKDGALRSMAMSYAFERKGREAEKYASQAYDNRLATNDFNGAAEVANELARILIESDDLDGAARWYAKGHTTALRQTALTDSAKDLWEFRWLHAEARIAARRGKPAEAQAKVAAAKGVIDHGRIPDQARFLPYLTGYVAFYGKDYKGALEAFQKADQRDPFILSLIAQSYEHLGDKAQATEYWHKVLAFNQHNPTGAFSRPLAVQRLK
ncbi:MAG: tetratricopeptide repeat protein [Gemmatimonadetes bacterium]|nr:tetratricopeptide repeat protein [Gemmatimonadota bacterium]MBI3568743.1 tetratricopeptide repeat protein [Gemmatimonadota bacterium]